MLIILVFLLDPAIRSWDDNQKIDSRNNADQVMARPSSFYNDFNTLTECLWYAFIIFLSKVAILAFSLIASSR